MPIPEPEVALEGLSWDGAVRNVNASFSVLNGIVIKAPFSSPSVTTVIFDPGYFACSLVFAAAMSEGLMPVTVAPLAPSISDLGNRNFRLTVTEPSALKVAPVSKPHAAAPNATAATRIVLAIVLRIGAQC